jgi:hypothetical protein
MAKIPLPELGQPLDVSYIYQIANALNELSLQVSPAIYKYVTVDVPNGVSQNAKASETRIIAGYTDVTKSSNQSLGSQQPFSYSFPADFKFAPIVTASPINIGGTEAGKNVSVVIKSVTTSKVDGVVNFNSSGDVSIGINLIIVGIPN